MMPATKKMTKKKSVFIPSFPFLRNFFDPFHQDCPNSLTAPVRSRVAVGRRPDAANCTCKKQNPKGLLWITAAHSSKTFDVKAHSSGQETFRVYLAGHQTHDALSLSIEFVKLPMENIPLSMENAPFIMENIPFAKARTQFIKENTPFSMVHTPLSMEITPFITE
jgi:hypothetical protein